MTEKSNKNNAIRPISAEEVYANKGVIMNIGKRLGWERDSRKDLVQEVAIKCWSDPRIQFNPVKGTLAGYLARIAKNTAVDMWRQNKHIPIPMEDMELLSRLESECHERNDEQIYEERLKLLECGIRELYRCYPSKEGNDAFLMFSLKGMSGKEVAAKLMKEERFVNVAVHRGMKRLTDIVQRMAQKKHNSN